MQNLIKPTEYAQRAGISRQAVYAKIKKGILKAKQVDGKLYIVVDDHAEAQPARAMESDTSHDALLAAKDETIRILQATIEDLKSSNHQITTTLRSEVALLKEAFGEMRSLYHAKLLEAGIETQVASPPPLWEPLKHYARRTLGLSKEAYRPVKKRCRRAYESGDARLAMIEGKLHINTTAEIESFFRNDS